MLFRSQVLFHWGRQENYPLLTMGATNWYQWISNGYYGVFFQAGIVLTIVGTAFLILAMQAPTAMERSQWFVTAALISVMMVPYFLPGMHERYFFAADLFALVCAFFVARGWVVAVLAQFCSFFTYLPYLLVVVENASTDNSGEILRPWMRQESRIRVISLTCPVAIPAARNVGLAQARGEYIATIDSDDVWLPDRLSRQLELMERPGHEQVGVCVSNVWLIDELGRTTGTKEFPDRHARCLQALWFRNPFCHSATLIPRSVLARCGQYDESFAAAEDLELWLRIGRNFELINLGDCLVKYRTWPGNLTSQRHRSMVRYTLRARRLAVTRYGYRIGMRERTALVSTWLAQWLPAGLARAIFESCVLRRSWRWGSASDPAEVLDCPLARPLEHR